MKKRILNIFLFINIFKSLISEYKFSPTINYTFENFNYSITKDLGQCTCDLSNLCDYNCPCDKDCDTSYDIIAAYTYNKSNVEELVSMIDDKYKPFVKIYDDLDPAVAAHWGPNAFGFVFVTKK